MVSLTPTHYGDLAFYVKPLAVVVGSRRKVLFLTFTVFLYLVEKPLSK